VRLLLALGLGLAVAAGVGVVSCVSQRVPSAGAVKTTASALGSSQTYASTCPPQACEVTADCTYSGCLTLSGCSAHACSYRADQGQGCKCAPGDCGADGKSICSCIMGKDGVVEVAAMIACPADFPTCSGGRCRCQAGLKQCVDGSTLRTCNAQGDWDVAPCTPALSKCVNAQCLCDGRAGQPCSHCGVFQCDGSCSRYDPPGYGDPCGHMASSIQCDGSCG